MPLSATPGSTVACTIQLPQQASRMVQWTVTDPNGDVVAEGQQPPTGTLVGVAFVMPSDARIPLDGSAYLLTATDGITSASDSIQLVTDLDPSYAHTDEIAYQQGSAFVDVLVLDEPATDISVTVTLHDGTVIAGAVAVDETKFRRLGNGYAYTANLGVLNTNTAGTYGMGSSIWTYTATGRAIPDQDIHAFWTVTPYSSTYLTAIRKIVDRARIGDANRYLNITTADLANALIRGMEVVIESPPLLTPFTLDQIPISLRDFVVKAAAADLLRAQYLAEGMSAFDMQGEGVQLQVDRSQYIDALAQQLQSDLQQLPAAKKGWEQQGMPLGGQIVPGKRPIGVLGLTTGLYSNMPIEPLMITGALGGGYSFARISQLALYETAGYR